MSDTLDLENAFYGACEECAVKSSDREAIRSLLAPLRDKDATTHMHYLHSLRVALLARAIARFMHVEERPALIAGALHDIGKALVPIDILGETGAWTPRHQRHMNRHVLDGYRMIRGRFDFSAEIMVQHHAFQSGAYPKTMPAHLHAYRRGARVLIGLYGRILAIADVYDALHRRNAKFGKQLSNDEIREKMLQFNPDVRSLIEALYEEKVLGA